MLLLFTSLTRMMDILDWATISQDLMCVYQSITPHILAIFTNTENSPLFSHYHFVEDNLNILEVFKHQTIVGFNDHHIDHTTLALNILD